MNLNTIVSAQVVLIAASGAHPGPQTRITSENIHEWVPSAEAILRVSNAFRNMGFTVGECVGNSISISGAVRLFESCFRAKLREAGGGVQFEGQGYELAANKIPSALRAQIAAVTFTPPPDFGTDTASSFRRFSMRDTHTIAVHPQPLPRAILNSTLMKEGGCAIFDHLPGAGVCKRLLAESRLCLHSAVACTITMPDDEEVRGGNPARRFISAGGGCEQTAFYHNPETTRFLAGICNAPVHPTGQSGTYTYYARPGDHLALHRDIVTCDISVITCLLDRHHEGSTGGLTRFYPGRQHEPLSRIRATPGDGAVSVRIPVGSTMVMFGGLVPHLIEPIAPGELRIVSILCFRISGS